MTEEWRASPSCPGAPPRRKVTRRKASRNGRVRASWETAEDLFAAMQRERDEMRAQLDEARALLEAVAEALR